ncbi:MAG: HepT-like ribonuclease domain-containing protein [Geobacteraceae bacterium]
MSKTGRDYILFLEDILDAVGKIENYVGDLSFDDFAANSMAVDAVIRNFGVIGEAAKNIPKRIRDRYPHVEWKEAVGFRNVLT